MSSEGGTWYEQNTDYRNQWFHWSCTHTIDGEGARSKNNNRSATITFTLLQTSEANGFLAAQHNLDILSANGDGIGPLIVKDGSGNSLYTADLAWVRKPPIAEFGRDVGSREWVLETHELVNLTLGN